MGNAKHKEDKNPVNRKNSGAQARFAGGKRMPRKITETYLHNAGLYYLQRFSASKAHFKSVMMRKVKRSCAVHTDQSIEDCRAMVDALADRFEQSGLLNDTVYARGLADSLLRRGRSRKAVVSKLIERGLRSEQIETALEALCEESGKDPAQVEMESALRFARKKRIGPFRTSGQDDPERTRKELGALARAGFSYEIARSVLNTDIDETF